MERARLQNGVCILCRIGTSVCAVPIEHISETMRPLPVEPLVGMPPFIAGVAVVRGVPTPVVDGARLLGGVCRQGGLARFLAIRVGSRRIVLAVDSVLGVRSLDRVSLEALPPLLHDERDGHALAAIEGLGVLDAQLLIVLESARLVPDSAWAAFDAASAVA